MNFNPGIAGAPGQQTVSPEMERWERLQRAVSRYENVGQIVRLLAQLTPEQRAVVLADADSALAEYDAI